MRCDVRRLDGAQPLERDGRRDRQGRQRRGAAVRRARRASAGGATPASGRQRQTGTGRSTGRTPATALRRGGTSAPDADDRRAIRRGRPPASRPARARATSATRRSQDQRHPRQRGAASRLRPGSRPGPTFTIHGLTPVRTEVGLVAGVELGPGEGVALAAEVLEGVGGGDGAQARADLVVGAPCDSPFMKPARNASPTPVGSTIRVGGTAGTSLRPAAV